MGKKNIANIYNPPKSNTQFSEGEKSKGILDDYAVRADVATKEGTIEHVPTNDNHIANKKYVDDSGFTGTEGSVAFVGSDGKLTEDNFNLFWNDATNELQPNLLKIVSDGTQASPALKFNDTNTGFFKSGDSVSFSLNNSTKYTIDETGFGIGTATPTVQFEVKKDSTDGTLCLIDMDGGLDSIGNMIGLSIDVNRDTGNGNILALSIRGESTSNTIQIIGFDSTGISRSTSNINTISVVQGRGELRSTGNILHMKLFNALNAFDTGSGTIANQYGFITENLVEATNNYGLYVTGATTAGVHLAADNLKYLMGGGEDASILYDGTDLVINPAEVGTGMCSILSGIRLEAKTGTTTDGDIWNDSTQKSLQTFVSGIEQSLSGCIFTQIADKVIADTTTETTMFGTGVGTLTLPADFWTVGKTIRLEIHGDFADTGNPTAEVQVYQGATSLIDSGAITLSGLAGTEEWECHVVITCRSVGETGTLETIIDWEYETTTGSSAIERLDVQGTTTTIDTTASQVLDATFQWGTAVAANTLTSEIGLVEVLN